MNVLDKVRSIAKDLSLGKGSASEHWALASRLLGRLTSDEARVKAVVDARDPAGLVALLDALEQKASAPKPVREFPAQEMDAALRAFMKKLKVSRLADESKLGGRYTSGGRKSAIDAMQPPDEFPAEIWPALVRAGKLRDLGGGFYGDVV
ncbi:MAG: hypothetical protein SFY95_06595 [Planctomycetota bacterium]|nr:hypothetical protein [Planctomycetota bacterium]